jgi:hypothetical protein
MAKKARTKKGVIADLLYKARVRAKESEGAFICDLTTADITEVWDSQDGKCYCCGIELDLEGEAHAEGIINELRATVDKVIPANGYTKTNIRLIHQSCNRFKGQMDYNIVYALARSIVKTFEQRNPETKVELDEALKSPDGIHKFMFPHFYFKMSHPVFPPPPPKVQPESDPPPSVDPLQA